jgi:DNA polymerase I
MCTQELVSGKQARYWADDLAGMGAAPFPIDGQSLTIAYYASAEMGCFLSLGWQLPEHVLDLFAEFRCLTNGKTVPSGNGLLGAMAFCGLDVMSALSKDANRGLAMRGAPFSSCEREILLTYCESDVESLAKLFLKMLPHLDTRRGVLRGRYMKAAARIERTGVPIDVPALSLLRTSWSAIKEDLIGRLDRQYGVFDGATFKAERWERWLVRHGIAWPRLASGSLDLSDDTFREMSRLHPEVAPIRELRAALSQMRLEDLTVGTDGRNRCLLSAFRAKTGRNMPSNSRFVFGPSVWLRGLIRPEPGMGLAYVDWSQQEFGIAAALSGDAKMRDAYASGDPYLEFARQTGSIPATATKETHGAVREQFKACVLGVQYGMGPEALGTRINQPTAYARALLQLHRETYSKYWGWSDATSLSAACRPASCSRSPSV